MKLSVNDELCELPGPLTVAELLARRGQTTGVAVAVDGQFVPRAAHATRTLKDGERIDIVAPMQGG